MNTLVEFMKQPEPSLKDARELLDTTRKFTELMQS